MGRYGITGTDKQRVALPVMYPCFYAMLVPTFKLPFSCVHFGSIRNTYTMDKCTKYIYYG